MGMVKIKRVRTADAVVAAFRFGKEEGTVGSLILGMYDDDGELHVVGHTSGFTRQAEARADRAARALPDRRARLGRAEPLEVRRGARLGGAASGAGRARSASTTSPATGSATARSSCAGATTRTRASAISRSCVPDPARSLAARARRQAAASASPGRRSTRRACATPTAGRSTARPATCAIGDVGGIQRGDHLPPGAPRSRGANLGWNCFSGTAGERPAARPPNYFPPVPTSTRAARTW